MLRIVIENSSCDASKLVVTTVLTFKTRPLSLVPVAFFSQGARDKVDAIKKRREAINAEMAAIRLEAVWRTHMAKQEIKKRSKDRKLRGAAEKITARWRGRTARKEVRVCAEEGWSETTKTATGARSETTKRSEYCAFSARRIHDSPRSSFIFMGHGPAS